MDHYYLIYIMIQVLIADNDALVRAGCHALLESRADIHVVAEAGDGYEAIALIKQCCPDVALLDVAMPNLNGLETTELIKQEHPQVKVIILSIYANEDYVIRALRAWCGRLSAQGLRPRGTGKSHPGGHEGANASQRQGFPVPDRLHPSSCCCERGAEGPLALAGAANPTPARGAPTYRRRAQHP